MIDIQPKALTFPISVNRLPRIDFPSWILGKQLISCWLVSLLATVESETAQRIRNIQRDGSKTDVTTVLR